MEFKDVLALRHSVRKYTDQPIDRAILDEMIDEALLAPSSKNTKTSGFLIVEDRSTLEALSEMREHGSGLIKGAAAAIVVLGDTTKTDLWEDNCAISATYLLLSATDKGLGSCWVHCAGRPRSKEDPSKGSAEDYVRELLGVKDEYRILCIVALGYPAE
ncbi:MAG: nitroreductase family protein [Bacteroidales bacterium]|nr:nitroreductase family protein [Bacteroidales bacterium]